MVRREGRSGRGDSTSSLRELLATADQSCRLRDCRSLDILGSCGELWAGVLVRKANGIQEVGGGHEQTARKGGIGRPRHGRHPQYPHLWDGNFPLSLLHTLRAARLHGEIVTALYVRNPTLVLNDPLNDSSRELSLISRQWPKAAQGTALKLLAQAWDDAVGDISRVPAKAHRALLLDLERRFGQ